MIRTLQQWVLLVGIGGVIGWFLGSDSCSLRFMGTPFGPTSNHPAESSSIQTKPTRNSENTIEGLQILLANNQYDEVFRRYDAVRFENDETLSSRYKSLILHHAHDLIGTGQTQHAEKLLKLILQTDYRDVDVQMALADSYGHKKNYEALIHTLYEAWANAYRAENITAIESQIRSAVDLYTKQLSNQDNQQGLLELYQRLTSIEPSYSPYFLTLAEIQMVLNQYGDATRSLELISHDPELATKAAQLLDEIERQSSEPSEIESDYASDTEDVIPLTRRGGHYLVNAYLNDAGPVTLLLDTGASMTVIKPDTLLSLGIPVFGSDTLGVFSTANGRVKAPIMALGRLTLGNQFIEQINIAVMELDGSSDIDGLLGMNFLQNFRFFIDQGENALFLSRE